MVRKQSAMKSTGKHISAESPRRSAESPLAIPFTINPRQPHFWNMKFLPERGYDMQKAHPSFRATVEALHWEKFVQHRTHYMEQLVREFYTGLITKSGEILTDHSMVRGVKVLFDEETINKHYDLSYTGNSFDEKLKEFGKKRMEQIKNRVAVPNAPWEKISHTEFKLKIRYIISELSNWHMFINCSIMPTSHNYTLPKDRLIILDSIMTDEEINIGRIINNEIRDCAKKTEGFLYFPCLITELCERQGVRISDAEKNQKKKPPSALSAEMKTRRVFKDPEELGKEKKVMKEKVKEEKETKKDEEKENALKRFLLDQHEWIKKRLEEISDAPTNLEIPEFPLWIFEDLEVEKETEKEESTEEEVVEKKETMKRKKPTKTKGKEKKKAGEVEWIEVESSDEEELEEELQQMEKETDEEEKDTTTESGDKTVTESDLDLSMEDLVRKKKGKSPILEQISPHQSPAKEPSPKPDTPPSTGTTPPPPEKTTQSQADVIQKEDEPTKETSPILDQTREQTPPLHDRSTILLPYVVSETGNVQVTEEISISAEGARTADKPVEAETGASAPSEPAPVKEPAIVATVEGDIEQTLNVVMAELAEKKRAELGNTQKFFKKPTGAITGEGSVGAGAPVKEAVKAPVKEAVKEPVKEAITEEPKDKEATEEDTTLKDVAATLLDMPEKTFEQPEEAEVQGGAQSPSEPAPEESTPKTSKHAALKPSASSSKSAGKKEKQQKPKPTPTRSSSRLRSGAKPQ